ncbi:hypothetical protein HQ563_04995 [bacterium]|nr:hypothetical protein [bacterium]
MKKSEDSMIGYPAWAEKSWWVTPDESILIEYLKLLVGIKRNVPNINARIHEVATVIALRHLSEALFPGGRILKEVVNPSPRKGPDIEIHGVTSNGDGCRYHAEVVTNFGFKQGPQADKLRKDVQTLIESNADTKILVVLFESLAEEAKRRCKKRLKNPIDLDDYGVEVASIEKMIQSNL